MAAGILVFAAVAGGCSVPERDMARCVVPALNINYDQPLEAIELAVFGWRGGLVWRSPVVPDETDHIVNSQYIRQAICFFGSIDIGALNDCAFGDNVPAIDETALGVDAARLGVTARGLFASGWGVGRRALKA